MPEFDDPEATASSRIFAVACLILTWVMMGLAGDAQLAAEVGGLLGLVVSTGFLARASLRGVIAGFPLLITIAKDEKKPKRIDPDLWFAQAMAFLAAMLLGLSLFIPPLL